MTFLISEGISKHHEISPRISSTPTCIYDHLPHFNAHGNNSKYNLNDMLKISANVDRIHYATFVI